MAKKEVGDPRVFPWTGPVGDRRVTLRLMKRADRKAVLQFTRQLPESEVAFLRMDITKPAVVDEWIEKIERFRTITVLALIDDAVAGYGSLHHNELTWTRHLGEIRLLVAAEYREGGALQQRLAHEMFHLAKEMKLARIVAQVPADRNDIAHMYDELGFVADALLTDWLMTADGRTHDLLILSHRVDD